MPVFKLTKDECFESWWRSCYEVCAETIEEAAELVYKGNVDPYDVENLPDLLQYPIQTEILDEDGNVLIAS